MNLIAWLETEAAIHDRNADLWAHGCVAGRACYEKGQADMCRKTIDHLTQGRKRETQKGETGRK